MRIWQKQELVCDSEASMPPKRLLRYRPVSANVHVSGIEFEQHARRRGIGEDA